MKLRSSLVAALVTLALFAAFTPPIVSAQDRPISPRLPPVCAAGQVLYYSPAAGSWYCSTTGPKVPIGGSTVTTATSGFQVAALTDATSTVSGTVQSTEYTLNSVTLKANALNANGRGVECVAWGITAANANAKNLKIYLGATAVGTVTGSTASGKDYRITLTVLRKASNAQTGTASIQIDTAVAPTMAQTAALAIADGADIVIAVKAANTAAAAASATGNGMACQYMD